MIIKYYIAGFSNLLTAGAIFMARKYCYQLKYLAKYSAVMPNFKVGGNIVPQKIFFWNHIRSVKKRWGGQLNATSNASKGRR